MEKKNEDFRYKPVPPIVTEYQTTTSMKVAYVLSAIAYVICFICVVISINLIVNYM